MKFKFLFIYMEPQIIYIYIFFSFYANGVGHYRGTTLIWFTTAGA